MSHISKLPYQDVQDVQTWIRCVFPKIQQNSDSLSRAVNAVVSYLHTNFLMRLDKYTILELLEDNQDGVSEVVKQFL